MTDRELLENAAKAAGIGIYWQDGTHWTGTDEPDFDAIWNPLTDDGDALRLAVKLKLGVLVCSGVVIAETAMDTKDAVEELGNDPYAATRRAIVRAAAAIGIAS